MPPAAPRFDSRLIAALVRLDRPGRPFAETNRRLGAVAEQLGVPRPSYEQTRTIVHLIRERKRHPGAGEVLLDVATQKRPPEAILELFAD